VVAGEFFTVLLLNDSLFVFAVLSGVLTLGIAINISSSSFVLIVSFAFAIVCLVIFSTVR